MVLLTNVLLDQTIKISLSKLYLEKNILKHQFLKTFQENFCMHVKKKFTLSLMTRFTSKTIKGQWDIHQDNYSQKIL